MSAQDRLESIMKIKFIRQADVTIAGIKVGEYRCGSGYKVGRDVGLLLIDAGVAVEVFQDGNCTYTIEPGNVDDAPPSGGFAPVSFSEE